MQEEAPGDSQTGVTPSRATPVLLWPHLRLCLSLQPCKQAAALLSLEQDFLRITETSSPR